MMTTAMHGGVVLSVLVSSTALASEGGEPSFTWARSNALCLGVLPDCPSLTTHPTECTRSRVGPCGDEAEGAPETYITSEIIGFLGVTADRAHTKCTWQKILDVACHDEAGDILAFATQPNADDARAGFEDLYSLTNENGDDVAGEMVGTYVVDDAFMGGLTYISIKSFLNKGSAPFVQGTSLVKYVDARDIFGEKGKYTGIEAPRGPSEVCASLSGPDGACTGPPQIRLDPGELMMEMFILSSGPVYAYAGMAGYGVTSGGLRTKLFPTGAIDLNGTKINGIPVDELDGFSMNVKNLSIPTDTGTQVYTFADQYHYGTLESKDKKDTFIQKGTASDHTILLVPYQPIEEGEAFAVHLDFLIPLERLSSAESYVTYFISVKYIIDDEVQTPTSEAESEATPHGSEPSTPGNEPNPPGNEPNPPGNEPQEPQPSGSKPAGPREPTLPAVSRGPLALASSLVVFSSLFWGLALT